MYPRLYVFTPCLLHPRLVHVSTSCLIYPRPVYVSTPYTVPALCPLHISLCSDDSVWSHVFPCPFFPPYSHLAHHPFLALHPRYAPLSPPRSRIYALLAWEGSRRLVWGLRYTVITCWWRGLKRALVGCWRYSVTDSLPPSDFLTCSPGLFVLVYFHALIIECVVIVYIGWKDIWSCCLRTECIVIVDSEWEDNM